jgi:hypothetical protein
VGTFIKTLPLQTGSGLVPGVVKLLIVMKNDAINIKNFALLKHSRYGTYQRACRVACISRALNQEKFVREGFA